MLLEKIFSYQTIVITMMLWLPFHWLANSNQYLMYASNLITLILIFSGCLGVAIYSIAKEPVRIWYPMTWFLLTAAGYYGFGPLLYYFGNTETVNYANIYYYVGDSELSNANLLNLTGIVAVLCVYLTLKANFEKKTHLVKFTNDQKKDIKHNLFRTSVIFVCVGIPIKLFIVLPRALGLSELVIPGGVEYFGVLSLLALAPLYILYKRDKMHYTLPFYSLLIFEGSVAFVMLSKLAILKIGIVLVLAGVLTGIKVKRLIVLGVIGMLIYAIILTPLITISRLSYSTKGLTNLSDTQSAIVDFTQSGRDVAATFLPGVQSWWSRLNYANAQSFAMNEYDHNRPGQTYELVTYSLIPRIIYPDKPMMTSGVQFHALITGDINTQTQSAPGVFAEAYWNGGWFLAIITFIFMGIIYWAWEVYIKRKLEYLKLSFFPVIWIGIFMAIKQDSWFAATTIGAIPVAVIFHFLAAFFIDKRLSPKKNLYKSITY